MKKQLILLLITGMSLFLTTSCLEEYLDKAPESGLTEDLVFTKYANFKLFFDANYDGRKWYNNGWRDTWNYKSTLPFYIDQWDQKYAMDATTDAADQGRYMEGHAWKSGNMSETIIAKLCYDGQRRPILGACFDGIRMCNIAMRNVDRIQDADDVIKNDFSGQAYFLRAWYHFTMFRFWGPMPYLDYVMTPFDETWDLARMQKNPYLQRIVQDIDSAYYFFELAGKIRRDPPPGVSGTGNYQTYEMHRPNGMAAKAFKSRVLLYAASPLNNANGTADWQKAAAAAWDAIQVAESNGVIILPHVDPVSKIDRHLNYWGKDACDESIWTYSHGSRAWNFDATFWNGVLTTQSSGSGTNPTQNWVDKYETLSGMPLNTAEERAAAVTAGQYNEQDPFANRDPRLLTDVVYNQGPLPGWTSNKAQIFFDGTTPSELLVTSWNGRTYTGYMLRKNWAGNDTKNRTTNIFADPLFRLTELYLNYAEAVNEAYGPGGTAPGSSLTAIAAINLIRTKSGMPDVKAEYTGSTEAFRPRIKNERSVELAFEGHHYFNDIRRWMDLPQVMSSKLIAMLPQKVAVSADYPTGFRYERTELTPDRQPVWEQGMYYLPFLNADALKMKNFVSNPVW
jgi:starch-binding outer membrane protein, SusD/RagB family